VVKTHRQQPDKRRRDRLQITVVACCDELLRKEWVSL
jgi:hypothetical protein